MNMEDHIFELRRKIWIYDWSSQLHAQLKQLWNLSLKKFNYMIFHVFIYILHILRVYYEVMGSNPVQPKTSGQKLCLKCDENCCCCCCFFCKKNNPENTAKLIRKQVYGIFTLVRKNHFSKLQVFQKAK